MNVCMPVQEDQGLQSRLNAHFGSAPMFMIVDTEDRRHRTVVNGNAHHAHGMCQPLRAIAGERVDAVVVAGIGGGAIARLRAAGIEVYLATRPTVEGVLAALAAGELRPVGPRDVCAHHHAAGHGNGPHGNGPHGHGPHGHGPHGERLG